VTTSLPCSPSQTNVGSQSSVSAQGPSVEHLIRRGVGWKAFSQITVQLFRVIVGIVLARLLTPADYGLAGMTLVFAAYVLVFADLGLGAAIVQRTNLLRGDLSTAFWTSVASGLAFTVIGLAIAWPASRFFHEPSLTPLFAAMSTTFLITSLGATHRAVLERSLEFRSLEVRTVTATTLGGCAGIGLALAGAGAWAIVGQYLCWAVVSTLLLWVLAPWHPSLEFSWASLRRLVGFSGSVLGNRLVYVSGDATTNALIGRFLGASSLGLYSAATNLALIPLSRLSMPVAEVLFPGFSRMQHDRRRIADLWLQSLPYLATATMPALIGLVVIAPDFVPLLLGRHWQGAVPVVQVLAWVGMVRSLEAWNSSILLALDRAKVLLAMSVVSFLVTTAAVCAGIFIGDAVAVAATVAVALTCVSVVYWRVVCGAVGVNATRVLMVLGRPIAAAVVMGVVVLVTRLSLLGTSADALSRVLLLIAVGIVSYGVALRVLCPGIFRRVTAIARRRSVPSLVSNSQPEDF